MAKVIVKESVPTTKEILKAEKIIIPSAYDLMEKGTNKFFKGFGLFEINVIICALVMAVISFWHGITGDDIVVNEYGKEILKFITSFGSYDYNFEQPLEKKFDRDLVIQYYGGLFSVICALFNKISPFPEYTTIHIFNALSGAVAAYFAGRILKRYVSEGAAVFVVWVMFLAPFWLGNAMNNPKDTPFAAAFIASLYFIFRYIDRAPNLRRSDYVYPIIAIACAINVRVGGVLLIPYLFLFLGGANLYRSIVMKEKVSVINGILGAALISVCAYFGASLIWPSALVSPISHPLESLKTLTNFPVSLNQLFEGKKVFSAELPTHYLPKAIFITTPWVILIGLLGLTPIALLLYKNKKQFSYFVLLCLVFAVLFPIAYIIYKKSNIYHLWRHSLFVFPIMATLVAFAYDYLSKYFNKPALKYGVIGMAALLLAEPLLFTIKTMPNTMSYFNSTVGGSKKAYGNYEVDFYYNSVKEACDWFKKNEYPKIKGKDSIVIATNAAHIVEQYFMDDKKVKIRYVRFYQRNESRYDYSIFHIAMIPEGNLRSGNWAKENVLYKPMLEGNALCALVKKPNNDDADGSDSLKAGNVAAGERLLSSYLQKDPNNELVLNNLAQVYLQTNKAENALPLVNRLMAMDSSSDENLAVLGNYYLQSNQAPKAMSMWEQKCIKEPNNMRAYLELALAQATGGLAEPAIANFKTAAQDPRIAPMAYNYLARMYQQMGNVAEAQRYASAAQEANRQ
jgi:Tfp pilus assembly protein PilF